MRTFTNYRPKSTPKAECLTEYNIVVSIRLLMKLSADNDQQEQGPKALRPKLELLCILSEDVFP